MADFQGDLFVGGFVTRSVVIAAATLEISGDIQRGDRFADIQAQADIVGNVQHDAADRLVDLTVERPIGGQGQLDFADSLADIQSRQIQVEQIEDHVSGAHGGIQVDGNGRCQAKVPIPGGAKERDHVAGSQIIHYDVILQAVILPGLLPLSKA